jgi:D-serine deaminase-like pyridoxal phosphate-dependent protein
MIEPKDWYKIKNIEQIDTPALVIYPQRVKKNIQILKGMIGDYTRLRPHIKTHKTKEATLLMMAAGINKFKCATIAEAEMLGMSKANDVLLAYQPFGPKLERFVTIIKKYPDTIYSCLVDNFNTAESISKTALKNNIIILVYMDLNNGMNRTGVIPGEEAIKLYEHCSRLKNIRMMGLHVYDGQINNKDIEERTLACNAAFEPVTKMKSDLMKLGYAEPQIIAGGSPTFPIHSKRSNVQCSPGTFIFWDGGYQDLLSEQKFFPAALIITRIISLPDETKVCLDLGYKSIASENNLNRRVRFLNAPDLKVISQSEEHLVLEGEKNHSWKIGDILYGLPMHICPTCALYESALIVENGKMKGSWKIIARDKKILI